MSGGRAAPWQLVPLVAALAGLVAGGLLALFGCPAVAGWAWGSATALVLAASALSAARGLWHGQFGADLIALLAMAGALALGQLLAGAIIAVMLTGGAALERFAAGRARRELSALLAREPRVAHRRVGEAVVAVPIAEVGVGDRLVVAPGEVLPTDGWLESAAAVLDESALTGEARPIQLRAGASLRSGGTNAGGPFEMRVTQEAARSTYAGIVRLVSAAEQSKAPFVRLADRYALVFLLATVGVAGTAWILLHDPVRALAVLVVATPCPLILAAPAAILSGVSKAARNGIIVKGGGALETLARVKVLLLDKTGTLTLGRPQVTDVESFGAPAAEVVRLAASVEQLSMHPFAPAIVAEARGRGLEPAFPEDVHEEMGRGVSGRVGERRVAVGQLAWAQPDGSPPPEVRSLAIRTQAEGSSSVFVAVDGRLAGALILEDPLRGEAPRAVRELRAAGVARIHLVTGDHPDVAELVGDALGLDRVFAERTPEEKVEVVRQLRAEGVTAMVGDGVNDAPALALADVGVAMGARGATAASEAADIVLTADRLEGLVVAMRIAKRTRRIALQSVVAGMGLSLAAMGVAAAGLLSPIAGAILQEGIDVLVILNALRALGGGGLAPRPSAAVSGLAQRLSAAHQALKPRIRELAALAARLDLLAPGEAKQRLEATGCMLEEELLPHEREEQRSAYPVLARMLQPEDPTGPLVQTHHEIQRLVRLFSRLVAALPPGGPGPDDLRDLRRALYGLNAVLTLHFAQEEELYSLLEA
ncbi:MAG TPA: heavy metal translocating P-type ATPase [Myxococcales bacterium]|nr:heavy metal translocating P-type ATPase [Myxococcales bacterium]